MSAPNGRPRPDRSAGGTPEQIHLTWGDDPARSVVVSWASPGQAVRPRVRIGQRVIPAQQRVYTDGLNGHTVWTYHARRDFGNNNQASAAHRPWMPVPGNHEIEFGNGPQGLTSYLTRYTLPSNGTPGLEGHWYSFLIGSVLFVSLSADDVAYQDAGAFVTGPGPLIPAAVTASPAIPAGTSFYVRGYSGGAQTPLFETFTLIRPRSDGRRWHVKQSTAVGGT
jgi:hypothetical protein